MRVAYFIDSLVSGGAQRQATELAVSLVTRGRIDAKFYVYRPEDFYADRVREAGIEIELLQKSGKADPFFTLRLRRALLEDGCPLVHVFLDIPAFFAALALRSVAPRPRPRLLFSERNSTIAVTRATAFTQGYAYRRADIVTANAQPVTRMIEQRLGVPAERIRYLPNGIDLTRWDESLAREPELRFDPSEIHLALIGRIEAQKNHVGLLRAFARVRPELRERTRLWFVGDAGSENTTQGEVQATVRELGLSDRVEFTGARKEVPAIMARLDGLVLPSRHEGFPNVVLEAMATGIPVLASRVGDVENLVADGECGFTTPDGDEPALVERLARLIEMSREERKAMGARGRAIVEARYQMQQVADQYAALYEEMIAAQA